MNLGTKLRIGFTIPAVMLLAAGVWSYHRFDALARGVDAMLLENDRSIQAANEMVLALERMDSGSLLFAGGQANEARSILAEADSSFAEALRFARSNVTIGTEPAILDSLQTFHAEFEQSLLLMATDPTFEFYRSEVLPAFLQAKHMAGRLRRVNQLEMQARAVAIGKRAYRAALPSAILALAALVFTALFAWLTHVHVVEPLRSVLQRTRRLADTGDYATGKIKTGDEIQELDEALGRAAARTRRIDPPR
ncbi:MAG: hypothetical protein R6X25_03880 [Candidatus Krumholzibacteriia bacterium]